MMSWGIPLLYQEREWIVSVYDVELCSGWLKHAAQVQSEVWNTPEIHSFTIVLFMYTSILHWFFDSYRFIIYLIVITLPCWNRLIRDRHVCLAYIFLFHDMKCSFLFTLHVALFYYTNVGQKRLQNHEYIGSLKST